MFKGYGKLIYDPHAEEASRKGAMKWWIKLDIHPSIVRYYQHWVRKELGTYMNMPLWGPHISVIRGEEPSRKTLWRAHEGERVEFEYDPNIQLSDKYCWLKVRSKQLAHIRMELGLGPSPRVPFHITIGNFKGLEPSRKNNSPPVIVFPWERPEHVAANCQPFEK